MLKRGDIFWIDNCPPLEGDHAKRRAVVVVTPRERLKDETQPVLVVAVTGHVSRFAARGVPMPNNQTHRQCTTGFTKPCWAIPEWCLLVVDRSILKNKGGYLGGRSLADLLEQVRLFIENGGEPTVHPVPDPLGGDA